MILPLVLPPVVAGVGLLQALGRRGIVGGWLDRVAGIQLTFTTAGAVVAATFVSIPLVVLSAEAGSGASTRGSSARRRSSARARLYAATRGPAHGRTATGGGRRAAWARALGEFGATITFAGNLEGRTQTLPLAVFQKLQTDQEGAIALSLVLVILSICVLVALRERITGTG